jgi:hypothetical protein
MKTLMAGFVTALLIISLGSPSVPAQDAPATITADSDAAGGLNLNAVAELFKDSENLEKFEHALNDHENGINNLDLNKDEHVDFIRVTEQVAGNTHLIVLQTPLGEDDLQDVATIAVEREASGSINLQVQGDPSIYGANYYVVPTTNNFSAWDVVSLLFRPNYHSYVSTYNYRVLPRWWTVRRPVLLSDYRNRTALFIGRRNFAASRTLTVKTLNKVNYHPRTSALVIRRPNATRTTTTVEKPGTVTRIRTETTVRPGGVKQTTTTTTRRAASPGRGRH